MGLFTKKKDKGTYGEKKLADMIISAVNKQEAVNEVLQNKGSKYRIKSVNVELGFPPSVSFSIEKK